MLVNCDVKSLEVVVAAELSGDAVLCKEILEKVDIHDVNRRTFGLGEGKPGRLVAKVLKFRIIYGGTGYSFAKDPDFTGVSSSVKFWEERIQDYYAKYQGIKRWHDQLLLIVKRDGYLTIPSGRFYEFKPEFKQGWSPETRSVEGYWKWPLTTIKNYPVQGFGADLVMLARIEFARLLRESGIEAHIVATVHDSIVVDCHSKDVYNIGKMLQQAVASVPELCQQHFNYPFSLPLTSEIQVGKNKLEMTDLIL